MAVKALAYTNALNPAWWFPSLRHGQSEYLRRAAEEGDLEWVQRILKGRTAADPKNASHTSALQLAARGGYLDIVKALVTKGADVNRVADGFALLDAAAGGHTETVKYLLERKADPSKAWNGNTALHLAANFGHVECVKLLLQQDGAKQALASANADGKTPLTMACCQAGKGNAEVAKLLIAAGADANVKDKVGHTLAHKAAIVGDQGMLSMLLGAGCTKALQSADSNGRTPLHLAAQYGRADVVAFIMKTQPDVSSKDNDGCTPLHSVARSLMCDTPTKAKLAKMMLDAGADVAATDKDGRAAADYMPALPASKADQAAAATAGPSSAPQGPVLKAIKALPGSMAPAEITPSPMASEAEAANSKGAKIAKALANGLAAARAGEAAAPGNEQDWVLKQALRGPSVEETATWKIGTDSADGKSN